MPSTRPTGNPGSARAQARLAEQQAERRRQRLVLAVAVIGIIVVVVIAAVVYQSWRAGRKPEAATGQPSFGPVQVTDAQPIVLGKADAPVTMTLFEDFRCVHCADFEEKLGPTITGLQRDGAVKVELFALSGVDPEHGSISAANAMACAATTGKGQPFYASLFANYGMEWSDKQLLELGSQLGLSSDDFTSCVTGQQHRSWVDSMAAVANQRNVTATPTVFINDKLQPDAAKWSPDQLKAAVSAAS
ncbi:DsbA family protein [Microlunatus elymi]|nr:thioredoxin domain-containing protein [Microlunatus elymi]